MMKISKPLCLVLNRRFKTVLDLKTAGVLLFEKARFIKLTEQHRSKDPEHTALLQKMSSEGRLHPMHLKLYKDLSEGGCRWRVCVCNNGCNWKCRETRVECIASQALGVAAQYNRLCGGPGSINSTHGKVDQKINHIEEIAMQERLLL